MINKYFIKPFLLILLLQCTIISTPQARAQDVVQDSNGQDNADEHLTYPVHDEYILAAIPDRLEWLNRKTFAFNRFLELGLLRPLARGYLFVTPKFFRTAVKNFTTTLKRPVSAANALLQGDIDNFFDNFFAFTHNILFGMYGLIDFYGAAADRKIYVENFDQTLAVYGVGYGSYLVLPVLNSSSIRGLAGLLIDYQINPVKDVIGSDKYLSLTILGVLNSYAESLEIILAAEKTSLDLYAGLRSFYYQDLVKEIYNGDVPPMQQPDPVGGEEIDEDDLFDDL